MLRCVRTVAVLALILLIGACNEPQPTGPPAKTADPTPGGAGAIAHATGPTDVLLRYDQGGGFVPIEFFASQVPIFTLYGDGTVIFRARAIDALPPTGGVSPNRPLRTMHLTEAQIQATLQMAIDEGGLGVARADYGNDHVADASTATFTLNAGGLSKTVSVYALGIDTSGSPDAKARAAFQKLAGRLEDFDQGQTIPTEPYVPAHYRGTLLEGVAGNAARPWPWTDVKPSEFVASTDPNGPRLPARVLTPAQAAVLGIAPFEGGFERLALSGPGDGKTYSFTLRPLLPDDDATPPPAATPPAATPPAAARFTPIETLTFSADGRRIDLTFVGAKPFAEDDPCSVEYAATTKIVAGVLEVGVFESRRPTSAPVACDLIGYPRHLSVDLDPPYTGKEWRDLYKR